MWLRIFTLFAISFFSFSHHALAAGDCDSNGIVTVSEVQSAIDMFLGLKESAPCNENLSGSVGLQDVQKAINAFHEIIPVDNLVNLVEIKKFKEATAPPGAYISFMLSGTVTNGFQVLGVTGMYTSVINPPVTNNGQRYNVEQDKISITNTTTGELVSGVVTSYFTTAGYLSSVDQNDSQTVTISSQALLPAQATIGDSGNYATLSYIDGSSDVMTWFIEAGNNGDAVIKFKTTTIDSSNTTLFVEYDTYTIRSDGKILALAIEVHDMVENIVLNLSGVRVYSVMTLASGLSQPYGMVIDSTSIYWTENIGGTVKKIGLDGGAVTTIASGLIAPVKITADVNNLYFTKFDYSNVGSLIKIAKNGEAKSTIISGIVGPSDLVVDSANVYWTDEHDVNKAGIDGGEVTTLASGLNGLYGHSMAIDSSYIYWTDLYLGTVNKVGLDGGQVITLAAGLKGPTGIAVDSTNVYWTEGDGRSVKKVGINGGVITTLASGLVLPAGIAVDSNNVYWTDYLGGTLNMVGINGGPVSTLAARLNGPTSISVDSTSVYWIDQNGGAIKKIVK